MIDIMLGGRAVGSAQVERQGLYYHFDCRCNLSGEVIYRIQAKAEGTWENLGIPVPEKGGFTLRCSIAVKKLGSGPIALRLVPKHSDLQGKFIPLSPEEPFRYLKRLQEAVLEIRDGKVGVVIKEL